MAYFDELALTGLAKTVLTVDAHTVDKSRLASMVSGSVTAAADFSAVSALSFQGSGGTASLTFPSVDFAGVRAVKLEYLGLDVPADYGTTVLELYKSSADRVGVSWASGKADLVSGASSATAKLGVGAPVRGVDAGFLVSGTSVVGHFAGAKVSLPAVMSGAYVPRLMVSGTGKVSVRAVRLTVFWNVAGAVIERGV